MNFFPSRYPIVEALMNPVSDLNLAMAVADAGAFPSLFITPNDEIADQQLSEFTKSLGNSNVTVPVDFKSLNDPKFVKVLSKHQVSHIEVFRVNADGNLIDYNNISSNSNAYYALTFLKRFSKLLFRVHNHGPEVPLADGYCIKGTESGGVRGNLSIEEIFLKKIESNTDKHLIPYGGINNPGQVSKYIAQGATAVAVGTLFALCKESSLSPEIKQKIINSSSADIKISDHNQHYLPLSKESTPIPDDDWNRSAELRQSIKNNGHSGFMYVSPVIDYVTEIRSVKEVVEYLVSEL